MTAALEAPAAPAGPAPQAGPWGSERPLTSYVCAERAAAAVHRAEQVSAAGNAAEHERLLQIAGEWRQLACSLATNPAMNRPREDRDRDDRRR